MSPLFQPIVLVALVLFSTYMLWEVLRWLRGNRAELTPGQFRRRMVGGVLMELDLVMWYVARPVVYSHHLSAPQKLLYLLLAMLFLLIPMLLAVREAAFVLRQYARWRGDLIRGLGRTDPRENGSR
jgi:hypothetical protein